MRSFLAGILLLAIASAAFGQVRGEVESIGFGGLYRPDCWTPMVVRLDSQLDEPAEYRIEVHQRDLDFDHVIYVKEGLTLNGHATQRWEVCFLPQPTNGGLPNPNSSTNPLAELQDKLRVVVTTPQGKPIVSLPITSTVQSIDLPSERLDQRSGQKLVLVIAAGSSKPAFTEYQKAIGLTEAPLFVRTPPEKLPQSVLAYQAVDSVLWISGKGQVLSEEGSRQLAALQQWVKQGGQFVVCQPASDGERQTIDPFADMLPVVWKENGDYRVKVEEKANLAPLPALAALHNPSPDVRYWDLKGKFPFARAVAKPNAIVDDWIDWDPQAKDRTPYIARAPYGLGGVTWVAQDLGNPAITGPKSSGWPYVWDRVFGWRNDTRIVGDITQTDLKRYGPDAFHNDPADLGLSQYAGVEFGQKSAGLIVLALFFFIGYWIVAGPGSYLFLAGRKRKQLSWAAFALSAVVATAVTVLVVRLVLRGAAEVRHATDVRMVAGQEPQPAIAYSLIGLYIPRDGDQHVQLADTSKQFVSYLAPMPRNPANAPDASFTANLDYKVNVRDEPTADPIALDVPFRSTQKKLAAKWCGDVEHGVRANSVKLDLKAPAKDRLTGSIDNLTGVDLKNVYVAFHEPEGSDYILYVPYWPAASDRNRIDLRKTYSNADLLPVLKGDGAVPTNGKPCRGEMFQQWEIFWNKNMSGAGNDLGSAVPVSFPMLSFFDRMSPFENSEGSGTEARLLLRHGARQYNMSNALAAGELVVLAEAVDRPLPFPLEVNGDRVGGQGTVFYQFALPIDHSGDR